MIYICRQSRYHNFPLFTLHFPLKNKPSIPQSGRKAFLPRYHPHLPPKRYAFQMQTHPRPVTGSSVRPYCDFRRQLLGESPALHASGSHHPALSTVANQYKAAQSLLFTYLRHINIFIWNMQVKFKFLDEIILTWYGCFNQYKGVYAYEIRICETGG